MISESIGSFTQYPLRLAWAVTIHKSQGKTFDQVVIDLGRGTFASGQTYVALSRCTSFEGLRLKVPLKKQHIQTDPRIETFLTRHALQKIEKSLHFFMPGFSKRTFKLFDILDSLANVVMGANGWAL